MMMVVNDDDNVEGDDGDDNNNNHSEQHDFVGNVCVPFFSVGIVRCMKLKLR